MSVADRPSKAADVDLVQQHRSETDDSVENELILRVNSRNPQVAKAAARRYAYRHLQIPIDSMELQFQEHTDESKRIDSRWASELSLTRKLYRIRVVSVTPA